MNLQGDFKSEFITSLASWLSNIFHPFTVAVATLFLITYLSGFTVVTSAKWTILAFGIVILPVFSIVFVRYKTGEYSDFDVSLRAQRHTLYILTAVCFLLLLMVLNLVDAPRIVIACLYAAAAANGMGGIVNWVFTKVSLHSVAMGGCASALFYISPVIGLLFTLIAFFVGWSRIYLMKHTALQVVLGWIISSLCVLVVFSLYL